MQKGRSTSGTTPEQGWATPVQTLRRSRADLADLVQVANRSGSACDRVHAPIRGGEVQVPAMTFKPMDQQPDLPGIVVDRQRAGGGVDSFVASPIRRPARWSRSTC